MPTRLTEHGQDDIAVSAGETDDGGVVAFAFVSFAVVERFGLRGAQRRERGEEHGVLQPVVAAPALRLAVAAVIRSALGTMGLSSLARRS
jgi:hypothetical protein